MNQFLYFACTIFSVVSLSAGAKKEEPPQESEKGCSFFDSCEDKGCEHTWSSTLPYEQKGEEKQEVSQNQKESNRKSAAQKAMDAESEYTN